MGHGEGAGLIGVAGVAAHGLGEDRGQLHERAAVDLDALLVDHVGKLRGLAGPAARLGVFAGAFGFDDVRQRILVGAGGLVVLREAVGLVQGLEHRVVDEVVGHLAVFPVRKPACIDIGVLLGPVLRQRHRDAGLGLHLVGDGLAVNKGTAEHGGLDAALLECVDDGALDAVGADGRAGDRVDLQALRLEDAGGQLLDGLGADAIGLLVVADLDLIDLLPIGHDSHGNVAIAPGGGAEKGKRAFGDLAVLHAGACGDLREDDADQRDDDKENAAEDTDQIGPGLAPHLFIRAFQLAGELAPSFHGVPPSDSPVFLQTIPLITQYTI